MIAFEAQAIKPSAPGVIISSFLFLITWVFTQDVFLLELKGFCFINSHLYTHKEECVVVVVFMEIKTPD